MPQIMIEAFARGLVDKIMLQAFDVLDTNDDKLRTVDFQAEMTDNQSNPTLTILQNHENTYVNCNGLETSELIENMVRGLRDIQIGDSSSVLPTPLTNLEKQVKRIACNMGVSLPFDSNETAEARIIHGQGDVQQIIHDAVIETPSETTSQTNVRREKENYGASEATRVSISLLHRMIEELETENEDLPKQQEVKETISNDGIAAWEENEELFIRTIEGVEDIDRNTAEIPYDSSDQACNFEYNELKSSSPLNSTSFSKNESLKDVAIDEITTSSIPEKHDTVSPDTSTTLQEVSSSGKKSRGKKKQRKNNNFAGRIRKLLRAIFGRQKN